MNKRTCSAISVTAAAVLGISALLFSSFDKVDKEEETVEVKQDGRLQYKWYVPETPRSMTFAGEKVPLERRDVREQLERELLVNYYGQTNTLFVLRHMTRYFPMIEQRLRANGVPDDFKYLCIAESSLMNQTSRAGAVGFWQFMKDTGPRYGLEINDEVDERYHVAKSTDAACRYLKEAYAKFGSWTGAAASYNCGMGGYSNFSGYQQTNYYYDMLLPEETMRYIFRILAIKHIVGNPEKMGFIIQKQDQYKPLRTSTVRVDSTIKDLAQFAIDKGTTYRMLKLHNPWLRGKSLTVKPGKSYDIELPE